MTETISIDDLKPNAKNPRSMSTHDAQSLKNSIRKFGDLSGIVFNRRSKQLVGGHQRIATFKMIAGEKNVVITQRFEQPNAVGTTAVGYVTYNGEFYGYREVDWDDGMETAANIAANRIQGEFDADLLAEMDWWLKENNPDMLDFTGQTNDEINKLLGMVEGEPDIALPDGDKPGFQTMSFSLSDQQAETVGHALDVVRTMVKFENTGNENSNGNALYFVAKMFLDSRDGGSNQ